MASQGLKTIAILLTALALVPSGAHFFELWNKIDLSEQAYFTVQGIYRGWALFGVVLVGAILANLVLAIQLRRERAAGGLAAAGFVLMSATLAIFFVWVLPANQATANWTEAPEDWKALRQQWEIGHAVNAVLSFIALGAVALGSLSARRH